MDSLATLRDGVVLSQTFGGQFWIPILLWALSLSWAPHFYYWGGLFNFQAGLMILPLNHLQIWLSCQVWLWVGSGHGTHWRWAKEARKSRHRAWAPEVRKSRRHRRFWGWSLGRGVSLPETPPHCPSPENVWVFRLQTCIVVHILHGK